MNSLGSVTLAKGMIWEEEFQYNGVIQEVRQTLGGRSHVFSRENTGPMNITLSSMDDQGWVSIATVRLLEDMSKDASSSYTLHLGTRQFEVYFRHFDQPVITTKLLIPRGEPLDGDLCTLTLKLITYAP